jgi:hypothetical protein
MLTRISGYIKKLKKSSTLLRDCNWSAGAMLALTFVLAVQSACDMPNYPWWGYKVIPTETYSYIDTKWSDHVIYETDYTIKYSKLLPPRSCGFSIKLPKSASGFIKVMDVTEPRDMPIKWADAPNGTVTIENIDKINPILLRVEYRSGKEIVPEHLVYQKALLDIQNDSVMPDSFYLKVENRCDHDIKTLGHNSNVSDLINRDLPELKNTSWTNQRVMIYDRGLPVGTGEVDGKGNLTWAINSIKPHEQKIYYFKKIKSV